MPILSPLRGVLGPVAAALLLAAPLVPVAFAQYAVGTIDTTFLDPARGDRLVPVDLYYPATSAGPGQPVAEPPAEGFAAVAFGHGYQISAGNYAWIAERLAGLGCVVGLPRTAGEIFPDHAQFGLDLAFAIGALRQAGADPSSRFFGRMGPRTLAMGHSMGGGCSLLAAAADPTLTAVANFAAAETDPSAIAACDQIDCSTLLFAGTNDCVTPSISHQIPMFEALIGWRTLVTITGASHCQFNAYSFLCDLGETCNPDVSRAEQQDLAWLLLRPWVRALLFLDSAAAQEFQALLAAGSGFTFSQNGTPTAVPPATAAPATTLEAFPNPLRSAAVLRVILPAPGAVRLEIFDVKGRHLRTLVDRPLAAGSHAFRWDGRDTRGEDVSTGVYLAQLSGAAGYARAALVLIR